MPVEPFERAKEICAILPQRPAKADSGLYSSEWRFFRIEKIASLDCAISQITKRTGVKLVRSGSGDHVDGGRVAAAFLCRVGTAIDLEFLDSGLRNGGPE